jgi:hypothetical protein
LLSVAGDIVNFNLPMASATTNLAVGLLHWKDAYENAGELENMYNSIKWPLDYFLKCWNANEKIYYAQVSFLKRIRNCPIKYIDFHYMRACIEKKKNQ